MRAVQGSGGKAEVFDVPRPQGDGVRVRVVAAGICGSDLHLLEQQFSGVTFGHEVAGRTEDGTAVAVEPLSPCGSCPPCAAGDYNLCTDGAAIIHGVAREGGMAEEMLVPERALVPLPAGLRPEDASLTEPLAVALHGLNRAGLRGGERVAVVGGGTIGLCSVVAALPRAGRVDLYARHDAQREAGARLGAGEADAAIGYDIVVDAAGTTSAMQTAVELARPGAAIAMVSTAWNPIELPMALGLKEVSIVPGSLYAQHEGQREVDTAAALLASSPDVAKTLVTHRFPLEAAPEAFAVAADRASGAIKVVLEPQ